MKYVYPAVFYPGDDGAFAVEFPDLPGCVSGGDDMTEAIEMAQDAACGWIIGEIELGNPINPPSHYKDIKPDYNEEGGFVNLLILDVDAFQAKHGKKAVHKNLTIPAYLATAADRQNVNYSQVLQNALIQKLKLAQ